MGGSEYDNDEPFLTRMDVVNCSFKSIFGGHEEIQPIR
jgi:hypothetical protein